MLVGIIAIAQLLIFRLLLKLQTHNIIGKDVDLREQFVVIPEPESFGKVVSVLLDFARVIEESVKNIALSRDVTRFLHAASLLVVTSL